MLKFAFQLGKKLAYQQAGLSPADQLAAILRSFPDVGVPSEKKKDKQPTYDQPIANWAFDDIGRLGIEVPDVSSI